MSEAWHGKTQTTPNMSSRLEKKQILYLRYIVKIHFRFRTQPTLHQLSPRKTAQRTRYERAESGVEIFFWRLHRYWRSHDGVLTRKESMLFIGETRTVTLSNDPYDPFDPYDINDIYQHVPPSHGSITPHPLRPIEIITTKGTKTHHNRWWSAARTRVQLYIHTHTRLEGWTTVRCSKEPGPRVQPL